MQLEKTGSPLLGMAHYPSLDGFRATAIIAVITAHIAQGLGAGESVGFLGGWGVTVFFVLSGFLITSLLLKERAKTGAISLRKFYWRRVFRIVPASAFFLTVMVGLTFIYDLDISLGSFLAAALYVKNLPIDTGGNSWFLGHFWTLAVEEQYYLLAPALLLLGNKRFLLSAIFMMVLGYVALYVHYIVFAKESLLFASLSAVLGGLVPLWIGSVTAVIFGSGRANLPTFGTFTSLALLGSSIAVEAGVVNIPSARTVSALILAALISGSVSNRNTLAVTLLNSEPMVCVGRLSYSLYLWQQLFTRNQFIFPLGSKPYLSIVANLSFLLAAACISYFVIERPSLRLKARFASV